jgi:HAD superfamily hydrolase (TIGR01509 family)
MHSTRAILFDCFGVLYPQAGLPFFERHRESFSRHPQAWIDLNAKIDLGKINREEFYLAQEKITGVPARSIMDEIDSQMNVDRNLIALIERLKPYYKIGFLSNAGREEIEPIFRDKIDLLFDATAVSYEVGVLKPDPEIFLVSAQRLGVEPASCLFVDDSKVNIEAAQRVGMKTLLYPTFGEIPSELNEMAVRLTE